MDDKIAATILTQTVLAGIQSASANELRNELGEQTGITQREAAARLAEKYYRRMLKVVRESS
jgi:hypothetical protein